MSETMLKDLIEIPTEVHRADFVISLSDGIDEAERTVDSYVVTDQLVGCFDRALGLIAAAVEGGASKGAYLHGSFGSGKSHFMAVLHLLLQQHPHARSKPELADVVAKYDPRLQGRKFLLVPYHMVGAESMEAGVLGGYVEHVRRLHPDAPMPAVYVDDALLEDAKRLREQMGDEAFFANLGSVGGDEGFGDLAGGWDGARFDAAVRQPSESPERRALVGDFIDAYARHLRTVAGATGLGLVSFADGLDEISRHASKLGYDGVVLFLDELILWFASRMADPTFVNKEGQKVAKLVEAAAADRPAPIVSFIARQRDLRDFLGQGIPGAERLNFGEVLQWWEGRFDTIELSDTNLRAIVEKRLLQPKDAAAADELDRAFDAVASKAGSALDTLLTSDADREAFRRVYPFSPAMIETLVAVSSYLQRERTALRLLLQLLVEKREELRVGDLVPLGDLYDVIRGGEEPFSDELKRHFVRARDLYNHKLRPMLMIEHGVEQRDLATLPPDHPFRTDDRLIKTLLLAALVPSVDPLRGLTVRRLADLNHGTIRTPVPGHEKAAVLGRLRKWAPEVPELQIEGDRHDPTVSLQLTGIDVDAILDQAAHIDNAGQRRVKIRELVFDALEIDADNGLFEATKSWVWRGSRRKVDVRFGNVRDETDIPSSQFRASDRPRVIIDFPFDDAGHGPADDLVRMESLQEELDPTPTVAWLPLFLTEAALQRLGRLVVLDHVLTGDRLGGFTQHLPPQDRAQAAHLLRNQADALRNQMRDILRQAYGIEAADEQWVSAELRPRDQFPSLDPTLDIRPPTAPNLNEAFVQILDQIMEHEYPAHPRFEDEVRLGDLRTALTYVEKAAGQKNQRLEDVPRTDRSSVRKVLGPLNVATTGEAHLVLNRHWRDHFHAKQQQNPGGPVTVERLKKWIDEPERMGLDDRVANFVVAAYVLSDNRVLVEGGQTVEPDVLRLEPTTEVRTQELPSSAEWETARPLAQSIFGVDPGPICNATNVSRLVAAMREVAGQHADACRLLADRLKEDAERVGVDGDADRLRTALAGRDLLEAVTSADDVAAVRALAATEPPTSAQAIGKSMKSARAVSGALQRAHWDLFDSVSKLPEKWSARAGRIRDAVADALRRDELAQPLEDVLVREEKRAATLLTEAAAPPPVPPPAPAPAPGRESYTLTEEASASDRDQAAAVLRKLLDRLEEIDELSVQWKFRE